MQKSIVKVSVLVLSKTFHVLSMYEVEYYKVELAWTEWVCEQEVVSVQDTGFFCDVCSSKKANF